MPTEERRKRLGLRRQAGCVAGAVQITELESMLEEIGFTNVRINPIEASRAVINQWFEGRALGDFVVSATIEAIKP